MKKTSGLKFSIFKTICKVLYIAALFACAGWFASEIKEDPRKAGMLPILVVAFYASNILFVKKKSKEQEVEEIVKNYLTKKEFEEIFREYEDKKAKSE